MEDEPRDDSERFRPPTDEEIRRIVYEDIARNGPIRQMLRDDFIKNRRPFRIPVG